MLDLISSTLNSEYIYQLDQLADVLQKRGIKVRAYTDSSLPYFNRHPAPKKTLILQSLRAYTEALKDVAQFDENVDMSQFVWRFLLRLGITPSEDLFTTISGENFIQIYNIDQFQIFRSLRIFERCSFTLEELTSKTWYELWERDSVFYFAITGLAGKLLALMKPTRLRLDFPYHVCREVSSESLFDFKYRIKTVSVLTRQNKAQAAVFIEDWIF